MRQPGGEETWEILNQCDYLKLNREEALVLTGVPDPETAARKLAEKVRIGTVVTLGGEEALGCARAKAIGRGRSKREDLRMPAAPGTAMEQDFCTESQPAGA